MGESQPNQRVPRQRDADDIGIGQQGKQQEEHAPALGSGALERHRSARDVGQQAEELGRQPALYKRILAALPGHDQGTAQQHRVDDMGNDLRQAGLCLLYTSDAADE